MPRTLFSLAGFQVITIGRFWVIAEVSGPVWQEESFDHVIRGDVSLEEKIDYIRQNPVRRGLVSRPEEYRWLWCESGGGSI